MGASERSIVTLDLRDAKKSVAVIGKATRSASRAETIRQIFLQLEREQKRLGVTSFGYGDITISPRK